jgi:hypothetical protein
MKMLFYIALFIGVINVLFFSTNMVEKNGSLPCQMFMVSSIRKVDTLLKSKLLLMNLFLHKGQLILSSVAQNAG